MVQHSKAAEEGANSVGVEYAETDASTLVVVGPEITFDLETHRQARTASRGDKQVSSTNS